MKEGHKIINLRLKRKFKMSSPDADIPSYNDKEFDENFRRFLNICDKILRKKDELKSELDLDNKGNPVLRCLSQYMRCYGKTQRHERKEFHVDLFQEIYNLYRNDILNNGHETVNWITEESIIIIYGSNVGLGNRSKIRIYLSYIFCMALDMKEEAEQKIRGNPDKDYAEVEELNYPDAYLLYLFRIFKSWRHEPKDTAKLTIIISDLEEKLGLTEGNQNMNSGTGTGTGMDGLLQFASGMMGQMGLPAPPEGAQAPSGDDVGHALQKVFGNPKTQETIGEMFKGLDECNDIGGVITKLVSGMSDPQFKDAIGESLNGMANGSQNRDSKDGSSGGKGESSNENTTSASAESSTEIPEVPGSSKERPRVSEQSSRPVQGTGGVLSSKGSEVPTVADGEIPVVGDD